MSVDTFISAVKDKRNDALEFFNKKIEENGGILPVEELTVGIDSLVGSVLDVVEEQYESLVIAVAIDSEGEEVDVSLGITADLSTLFFEEINN